MTERHHEAIEERDADDREEAPPFNRSSDEPPRRDHLPTPDGGPVHLQKAREHDRHRRNSLVAEAIADLEAASPEKWPDVEAILEHSKGRFSKNRVYDEQNLMYAAQSRWNDREKLAGRKPRKLRGGDRAGLADWVPAVDLAAANSKLARALDEVVDLQARNKRLSKENKKLTFENEALQKGVVDELWSEVEEQDRPADKEEE